MEKQTMGKFIAALRKANGMTQAELAEKLSVSNKSVSKWECDEGYPDLSLIPVIAEIFNVTSDEILKGARITQNSSADTIKTEKQTSRLIQKTLTNFKNLSFISIFIGLLGTCFLFIPLIILNLNGLMNTVFYIICFVFFVILISISIILEIVLMNSARSALCNLDEENDKHLLQAIKSIGDRAFNIITIYSIILIFGLPFLYINLPLPIFIIIIPISYEFAYIVRMIVTANKYYDLIEQQKTKKKLRTYAITCISIALIFLLSPLISYFIACSGASEHNTAVIAGPSMIICFLAINASALFYIFKRKNILKPHSKLK